MTKEGPLLWSMFITGASCLLLEQEAGSKHDKAVPDRCKTKKWEVTLEKAQATGKFVSLPWFVSSASSYFKNRNKAHETLQGGSCSEGKMLCAANSLSQGPSALRSHSCKLLADEAMHTHRKETHKLPLKRCLFLLTFAAQSQLANFTKGPCHSGRQPFQASPDPAYKRREKCLNGLLAGEAAGATSVRCHLPAPGPGGCCQLQG